MKKYVLAAVLAALPLGARAADITAAENLPVVSWTGGYVGLDAGGSFGKYTQFSDAGDGVGIRVSSFTGGVYGGYNFQFDNIVAGVEADISNGPSGTIKQGTQGPQWWWCTTGDCNAKIEYYGTVRGRLGYAVDRFMVYGTAGFAYGKSKGGIYNSVQQGSGTSTGWTAGGGAEYAFNSNWLARAEYLHVNLGDIKFGQGGSPQDRFRARGSFDTVRLGLAYKF